MFQNFKLPFAQIIRPALSLFVLVFGPNLYAWEESELGVEYSTELRAELRKRLMLDDLSAFDPKKVESFLIDLQKKRDNLWETELKSYSTIEETEKKAIKEAKKNVLFLVSDQIVHNLEMATLENEVYRLQYLAKNILKLESSFIKEARYSMLKEVLGGLSVMFFEKHTIPLNSDERKLPSNLSHPKEKRYFTPEELSSLEQRGDDLSVFDPPNSSFWRKPKEISQRDILLEEKNISGDLPKIFYFKKVKKSDHHPKLNVYSRNASGKKVNWKLKVGNEVHTEIVGVRLMDLLGFKFDKMNYIPTPKVYFQDKAERNFMIREWLGFYHGAQEMPHLLIKEEGEDENGYYVVFHEGSVEWRDDEIERVGSFKLITLGAYDKREVRAQLLLQGILAAGDIKEAHNNKILLVQNQSGEWEIEELIHDLGKALGTTFAGNHANKFPWHWIETKKNEIRFKYGRYHIINDGDTSKNPFMVGHYSDIKWIARYLATLTQKQIFDMFTVSGMPTPVAELYGHKMTSRRNDVIRAFDLEGEKDIEGKIITIWPEIDPKNLFIEFNEEMAVEKGKLKINFASYGSPIQYAKPAIGIGKALEGVMPLLINFATSVELDSSQLPISYPNLWASNGDNYTKRVYAGLVSFIFHREIETNHETENPYHLYRVNDTFEVRLNVGGRFRTILGLTGLDFRNNLFIGQRWGRTWMSSEKVEAMTKDWDKLFRLPLNWKKDVSNLSDQEEVFSAKIFGFESKNDLTLGVPMLVGIGPNLDAESITTNQMSFKKNGEKIQVNISQGPQNDFNLGLITKFLNLLRVKHASLGIYGSKATHLETTFNSIEELDWNWAIENWKDLDIDMLLESDWDAEEGNSITKEKTRGTYRQVNLPIAKNKKSRETSKGVVYQNSMATYFLHGENTLENIGTLKSGISHAEVDVFSQNENFQEINNASATLNWEIDHKATTVVQFKEYLDYVNTLVGDKDFLAFKPENFNKERYGEIEGKILLKFSHQVLKCLVEQKECRVESLNKVRNLLPKLKNLSSRRELGRWARDLAFLSRNSPQLIGEICQLAKNEVSIHAIFTGEFLPTEDRFIINSRNIEGVLP